MTTTTSAPSASTYKSDVDIRNIRKHPKNPRRRATADQELIDSVKVSGLVQPLILARDPEDRAKLPSQQHGGLYILIAGHRRLDALKKSRRKTAPAVIRADLVTEGQQIEAMLVENGRRSDLTPIEEAEGYHQLELLGYKAPAIATAVGRDVKTVRSRVRLLKLAPSTQKKVHGGQISIDDALAIASFADDPDVTKQLERDAGTGNFKWSLEKAKARRKAAKEAATQLASLLDTGAKEISNPSKKGRWQISDLGVRPLGQTHSEDWKDHDGCLGAVIVPSYPGDEVVAVCTDPASHNDQLEEADRKRAEEADQLEAARKERRAAEDAARAVRLQSTMDSVAGISKLPPQLTDVLRALLPSLLRSTDSYDGLDSYFEALGVEQADRWNAQRFQYGKTDKERVRAETLYAQHVDDIAEASAATLVRHLVALLLGYAEKRAVPADHYHSDDLSLHAYLQLLEHVGHPFSDVDVELRDSAAAALRGDTEKEAS